MRMMGPPFLPDGESAYFLAINRNKKSLALDLSRDRGREVLYDSSARRTSSGRTFGRASWSAWGWRSKLYALNQRIIVCAISAYGQGSLPRVAGVRPRAAGDGRRHVRHRGAGRPPGPHGTADGRPGRRTVRRLRRRGAPVPARAHGRGPHRPLAARLPGLPAHVHRPVLLDERASRLRSARGTPRSCHTRRSRRATAI